MMKEIQEGRARILIIDDEPEVRIVLCDLLGASYECSGACSAQEALALLRA